MRCLDNNKGTNMKTYLPYILICALSFGAGYFFTYVSPEPKANIPKEALVEEQKQDLSIDPTTSGEVIGCEPKIIYRDRLKVVPLPIEPKVGCNIDWKTKKIMLYAPLGYKIKCWVNYETGEYRESIVPPKSFRGKSTKLPSLK